MKKIIIFLFSIFTICYNGLKSQDINPNIAWDCLFGDESSDLDNENYGLLISGCEAQSDLLTTDLSLFMVDSTSKTKYIRVNVIILQKDDGTGNFSENNEEDLQALNDIYECINARFRTFSTQVDSCEASNRNVKIQFLFNNVFVRDSELWNIPPYYPNGIPKIPQRNNSWYLYNLAKYIDDTSTYKSVNMFFANGPEAYEQNIINNDSIFAGSVIAASMFPSFTNYDAGTYLIIPDVQIKYHYQKNWSTYYYNQPWIPTVYGWFYYSTAGAIIHEFGHMFNMLHEGDCFYNNIMNNIGSTPRNFLSDFQVFTIHKNISLTNLRSFIDKKSELDTWVVDNDNIIDFNGFINSHIVIDSGGCLTVKCKLLLPEGAKITVHPGGKLIVDGGVITSKDNKAMWQGIVLESAVHNGIRVYGEAEIINGAIIENSRIAISGLDPEYKDWSTVGGKIYANKATFINNIKSIALYPNTKATIENCVFGINENYIYNELSDFKVHITAWKNDLLNIKGCLFYDSVYHNSTAIGTIDARLYIDEFINNDPGAKVNTNKFNGFKIAIEATQTDNGFGYTHIKESVFNNNIVGIKLNSVNYAKIYHNNFNVYGSYNILASSQYIGLNLDNCTEYNVEENTFNGKNNSGIGVLINNSMEAENIIYRNTFKNLLYACKNLGNNGININVGRAFTGLQYNCNIFINNIYDIYVSQNSTIRMNQGSLSKSAGNNFSKSSVYNIYNENPNLNINYYYAGIHDLIKTYGNVKIISEGVTANDCEPNSWLYSGSDTIIPDPNQNPKAAYNTYSILYDELYDNFIESGYDIVIDSLIEPGYVLNDELLTEALTLSDTMSSLTRCMSVISNYNINKIINETSFNGDTILSEDYYELIEWLEIIHTTSAKYDLVFTYFMMGDYTNAEIVINNIPVLFELTSEEEIEYYLFTTMYYLLKNMSLEGRNLSSLNDTEILQLKSFATSNLGRVSAISKGILCHFYNICLDVILEDKTSSSKNSNYIYNKEVEKTSMGVEGEGLLALSYINVYPNPTNGIIYIDWYQESPNSVTFELYNMQGALLKKFINKTKTKGICKEEIDLNSYPSGNYIYRLIIGNKSKSGIITKY